jgi:adenosylcobinamide-GDP ribazoletransferase
VSAPEGASEGRIVRELRSLLTAVQYFTRLPVPVWVGHNAAQLARAARYFPLVGIGVGALGAAALWVCAFFFTPLLAVIVSTALTVCITGAFHEDGLADTVDGLGGALSRERALEIMKDSRIGTFGVLALLLAVLLKIAALAALPLREAIPALIAGHGLSRACAVALTWRLPYAREDASTRAKPVVENVRTVDVVVATLCGLAPLLFVGLHAVFGLLAALVAFVLLYRWFQRGLGGYTGDTLGATQQICEVAFYLALLAAWNSF